MKQCPRCNKKYGDWREQCPDCSYRLSLIVPEETEIEKQIRDNNRSYRTKKKWLKLGQTVFTLVLIVMVYKIAVGFVNQNLEDAIKTAVADYDALGQHEDVLQYMNDWRDFVSTRPELQEIWDRNADTYRGQKAMEARELFDTEGYSDAMDVLYIAQDILGEDEELEAEIDKYSRSRPDYLIRLKPQQQGEYVYVGPEEFGRFSEYWLEMDRDLSDSSFDNTDIHFVTFGEKYDDLDEKRSITYSLGKCSAWLTGYVYVPQFTRHCALEWSSPGVAEIYGDGELLYTQSLEQGTDEAVKFRIWIGDVDELTIVLKGSWMDTDFDDSRYYPKLCLSWLRLERIPRE